MAEFYMRKVQPNLLEACDEDAERALQKFKLLQPVKVSLKRARNYEFHKRYFALLNYAFEFWEPPELPDGKLRKNVTPEKSFDRFRKDLTILAGYYDAHYRVNGEVRIEAKSISFASMDEDTFEALYSKTIDVILKHVMTHLDEAMLREAVDEILRFAA